MRIQLSFFFGLACWLLGAGSGIAQVEAAYVQVSGIISNKVDGQRIQGVKITNMIRGQITMTNENGVFALVAKTGDQIRLSHVGMAPQFIDIPEDAKGRFFIERELNIDPAIIEEVIVNELPNIEDLADYLMALNIPDDPARELALRNPDLFNILDTIIAHEPALIRFKDGKVESSPISWFYENVYKKIKEKMPKPKKRDKLPPFKRED